MDIRYGDCKPIIEHVDVVVHSMIPKFSVRDLTKDGYLEFVDVFEIAAGAKSEPHRHDTHEYFFILEGEVVVQIEDEARRMEPNQLVHIPRNAAHTIWPINGNPMKGLSFAISYQEPYDPGYVPVDLPEVPIAEEPR